MSTPVTMSTGFSRLSSASFRVLRACLTRVERVPASAVTAVTILIVSLLTIDDLVPASALGATAREPWRWWTLITSFWATRTWHVGLALALAFIIFGGIVELAIGKRKWLLAVVVSSVIGVGTVWTSDALFMYLDTEWNELDAASRHVTGAVFGLVGLILAGSARMQVLGRRRLRAFMFSALLILAAFGGTPQAVGSLAAGLTGLILGHFLADRNAATRSFIGTRHRGRSLAALIIVTLTAGTALSILSSHAVGPLSLAANGLGPGDITTEALDALCARVDAQACRQATNALRIHGLAPRALILMPVLLQMALAWAIARGRRAAAIATVALQSFVALLAVARLILVVGPISIPDPSVVPTEIELPPVPLSRILVSILIPAAMIAIVVWNHSWFQVKTPAPVLRRTAATILVTSLGLGLIVVLAGMSAPHATAPQPTPWLLASNYAARLLPPSALSLLTPTLLPVTWIGRLLVEWAPIATWMTATLACVGAVLSSPEVDSPRVEDAQEPADFVRQTNAGSLGWMHTWPGNEHWRGPGDTALVTYRNTSGVALTVTDPAAIPSDLRATVTAFAEHAAAHSLIPALYSVHADTARIARELGWTTMKVAEEAVIDLPGLAFTGKKWQDVRTAINRADKEGITAEWTTFASCPQGVRDQLRAISDQWVEDKSLPEMGFTLGSITEMSIDGTRVLIAKDADGTVHAVTSWLPVYEGGELIGLTLDVMRKRDNAFRPSIEFLIGRAILDARDEGLQILSLSGAPLAHSGLAPANPDLDEAGAQRFEPVLDYVGSLIEPVYGFRSLLFFKKKFQPRFESLYLAVPDTLHIPTVGLAISRAYLPDLGPAEAARFAHKLLTND